LRTEVRKNYQTIRTFKICDFTRIKN
jgi:hypothetical protein